ncbi:MAG: hypothetical protein KIT80_08965 [Chitinophagaceae bacterium]|nr:hypothetical protein [Chitinophagaceae bacterium]MCW5927027.1 hypothetical protein [Chitinophagaceae bacterium]
MKNPNSISSVQKDGKQTDAALKPNLPKHLFWDQRYDEIDWVGGYRNIIARVIERGNADDWQEMLDFYGQANIVNALLHEIKYLPDFAIEDACNYFNLRKEDLLCYTRKQSRREHWI